MLRVNRTRQIALAGLSAAALSFAACDKDSDSSAKVVGQDEFNPPGGLVSVTGDKKLQLWWTAANVEDDFKGFYVFVTKKAKVGTTAAFPAGVDYKLPTASGVPYCALNSKFFEAFGFKPSVADCEGKKDGKTDEEEKKEEGTGLTATGTGTDEEKEDEVIKPTSFVKCDGNSDAKLSIGGSDTAIGLVKCTTSQYWDTDKGALADMVNGEEYAAFVVGVLGDDYRDISWTSNVVTDTPAILALNKGDGSFKVAGAESFPIEVDTTAWTAAVGAVQSCGTAGATAEARCQLNSLNSDTTTKPTVWISRDNRSGTQKQRLFVSTSNKSGGGGGWTVQLQTRGPQIALDNAGKVKDAATANGLPGDQAYTGSTEWFAAGKTIAVYNNQVVDLLFTKGTEKHYGKLVIGDVTFDGSATDPATAGNATIQAWMVIQSAVNNPHYFQ